MHSHSQIESGEFATSIASGSAIDAWLSRAAEGHLDAPAHLWGFGGLHGGLALAATVARIERAAPPGHLRSASGRFFQPIRGPFEIDVAPEGEIASVASYGARLTGQERTLATASALWGVPRSATPSPVALARPTVPPWDACERLEVPPGLVPVAAETKIHPVGRDRPFAGGPRPELTAWVRLAHADAPPDPPRLLFLLDALAPSYSAVLDAPTPIPTVEMAAQLAPRGASSPWVLLAARTETVTDDGWIVEQIDAWDEDGRHLARCTQLRVIRSGPGSPGPDRRERNGARP